MSRDTGRVTFGELLPAVLGTGWWLSGARGRTLKEHAQNPGS